MNNQSEVRLKKLQGKYLVYYIVAFVFFFLMLFLYLSGLLSTVKLGPVVISAWTMVRVAFPGFVVLMVALTISYYSQRAKVSRPLPSTRR